MNAARTAPFSALILRPKPQAEQIAAQLRALGLTPYIVPMSRIAPLPARVPRQPYTALLAASANAFAHRSFAALKAQQGEALLHLPLYCVGQKTAAAAQAQGVRNIAHIAANADALCSFLARQFGAAAGSSTAAGSSAAETKPHFLYLAGRPRRPQIEQFLNAAGLPFFTAELYQTISLRLNAAAQAALPPVLDAVLLYSAQNARALTDFAAYIGHETQIFCLSARVKAALPPQWQRRAPVAASPDSAALLNLLVQNL